MSEPPATVVRRFFERYEHAGVEGALEVISPEAVLVVPPEVSSEPDVYEGVEGGRRYFAGFEGALDDVRFELHDLEEPFPGTVLAVMTLSGRGSATGIPVEQAACLEMTVRGDAVERIVVHPDLESARRALDGGPR
jgi:ketosteroid isomerase-like protein